MIKALAPREDDIIFYTTPDRAVHIEVFFQNKTCWLNQKKMAELFGVDVRTVNEHLGNIFNTKELAEDSVIRKIPITAENGKNYLTNFYNLDASISLKSPK